jgi:excisionase family DNA binding protein
VSALVRLPDPREKPWLTVAELATITGEGEKAIRAALDAGQLPMLRVGRYVRIPTAALLVALGIDTTATSTGGAGASTAPTPASDRHSSAQGAPSSDPHTAPASQTNVHALPRRE